MNTEFDIDAPADMELLGGTFDGEAEEPEVVVEEPDDDAETATDAEPDESADDEVEPEPVAKRDPVIPRARFDEVNAKLHAEREEVERLRAELEATRSKSADMLVDTASMEKEYFQAMMEGDQDKAIAVRAKINAEFVAQAEANAEERVLSQLSQREAAKVFNDTVSQLVSDHPFLDSNSASANAEAIADVVEWRNMYMAQGAPAHVALQKAVSKIAPMYAAKPESAEAAVPAEPVVDKRKQLALVNAAKAASAQPPRVDAGVGNRAIPMGDAIIDNQDKWEKASDAERLRYLS